jgi:hypothetical protein
MKWPTFCLGIVSTVLGSWSALGQPAPVEFHDPTGAWHPVSVHRTLTPAIDLELVAARRGSGERLYMFRSEKFQGAAAGSAIQFAHDIRAAFAPSPTSQLTQYETSQVGFQGHESQFHLLDDTGSLECTLFTFVEGSHSWALLQTRPKGEPATQVPPFEPLRKKQLAPQGVVELDPLRVKDDPLTSFPISFEITREHSSNQVKTIVVREVPEGSTTAEMGVKVGDEIIKINGRQVSEFRGGVTKDSEIGRIFINRRRGDKVDLELLAAETRTPYAVTLRIPKFLEFLKETGP